MAEDIRIRLTFRPGFARDRQAAFERAQFAFSQKVAAVVDPYVHPLKTQSSMKYFLL